ncbi:MAG TPA: hypothetical protein VKP30_07935 [Polyangiaceae bacterium]|nr:hypothetical protein [Polyangiaceae bacterium]
MLVLLGPRYSASDEELNLLASETGLSPYDLRMRLRPGAWSVVRAIADGDQAQGMAARIRSAGLQCCALESSVGLEPARQIVYLREIDWNASLVTLRLAEREMTIPIGALLTVVRGDVHLGRTHGSAIVRTSSSSLRAAPAASNILTSAGTAADVVVDQRAASGQEVFMAADLHFVTVPWLARIDSRDCVIRGEQPESTNLAERLDRYIDELAQLARIRVDRDLKISNLATHCSGAQRHPTPSPSNGPISARRSGVPSDEYFDAYSRLIGEAERRTWTGK